jgi:ribonucleoside-diphosphate reductase alpha chain
MSINYKKVKEDWIGRGEAPTWVSTNLVQFFSQKYAFQGETWKERVTKVCEYLAENSPTVYPEWWEEDEYTKGKTYQEVYYNLRYDGFIVDSTPLFANSKVPERGMTISCSGATLFNSLSEKSFCRGELEQLVKNSHGCAWNFKDWLSYGDLYDKDGNRSEGILPIIDDIDELVRETNQG